MWKANASIALYHMNSIIICTKYAQAALKYWITDNADKQTTILHIFIIIINLSNEMHYLEIYTHIYI